MTVINPKLNALMRVIDINKYQTFTVSAILTGVGATAEAVIDGKNTAFWITDIIPAMIDNEGRDILKYDYPCDAVRVGINIGGLDFTNNSMPLAAFINNSINQDLQNGFVLRAANRLVCRFTADQLPHSTAGVMRYPILVAVTLKGYEISKIGES